MPIPSIEALRKTSGEAQIKAAISSCIATEMKAHPDWGQDKCVAACYSMAREKTGKGLKPKGG